jgi:hypothetical protein
VVPARPGTHGCRRTTAFVGAGRATAPLLTRRQGSEFFKTFEHAASGSVQNIDHKLLDDHFAGTDHVFRLNGVRVEAFSGVQMELFRRLAKADHEGEQERADITELRSMLHARRNSWPHTGWDAEWGGPVSIHQDGTVLAIRVVNVEKKAH